VALDVTADSNIYISALVFAGRPLQFLDAARAGVFRLAISDPLLAEIYRVLREKFRWPADDARRRLHGVYQPITAALSEPAAMLAWLKISPGW
jgi:hypothetical protein